MYNLIDKPVESQYLCVMCFQVIHDFKLHGILIWLALSVFSNPCFTQVESIQCDVLRFQHEEGAYAEVQIEFQSRMLVAISDGTGWHTEAEIQVIAESEGQVVGYGKALVQGPIAADSASAISSSQLHIERLSLPPGDYDLEVILRDVHGSTSSTIHVPVAISDPDRPQWSDPFIVEAFAPSDPDQPSSLSRSGYEMLPIVGARIGTEASTLQFYAELYHVDQVVDSLFLVSVWMEGSNGVPIPSTRRYFRKHASAVVPIFTSVPFDVSHQAFPLHLVVAASTRANNPIAETRLPLEAIVAETERIVSSRLPSYVEHFTDSLTLLQHIQDHHPLGTISEQRTIDAVMPVSSVSQMQAFLTRFWEAHAAQDPELGWRRYTTAIAYVDSMYGACRSDHGAQTDMGYIYLRYGPPNTVVKRHNGTDYYPYEIWHYHRAASFSNKRFLFFSPHMVSECFTLLHSDMIGEVRNSDWLHILRNRENSLRVTESQMNRLNQRQDTYSREEPEDLFFNPR